jgi:glycosyltransferase involved in cell wall biosynthesis
MRPPVDPNRTTDGGGFNGGPRRACLAMLDPVGRGGIATMAEELYRVLEHWAWRPGLLYLSASPEDRLAPWQLLRQGRFAGIREKTHRGMRGMAVGHLPAHFFALSAIWPYRAVRAYIDSFSAFVVLGTADRGITLALMRKPYVCWLATALEDDLRARASLGDEWARRTLASPAWLLLRWQERFVLRHARLIMTISQHTADRLRVLEPQCAERVRVVPVPVDVDTFRPRPDGQGQVFRLLFVGRAGDARKNIGLLLQALKAVLRYRPRTELVVVSGDAPGVGSRLDALGIRHAVRWVPTVDGKPALARYFQDADLFVLPSKQEGLGIVVLEAMAAGLPVVSTRCGGPEMLVRHGETGLLVPTDDSEPMAQAILRLAASHDQRKVMGANARRVAIAEFSREAVGLRLRQAFMEAYGRAD